MAAYRNTTFTNQGTMQEHYSPKDIEAAAQQYWEDKQAFSAKDTSDKPKY